MPEYEPPHLEYIKKRMNELPQWYHNIDLGHGIVTPGRGFDGIWNMIREVMAILDYKDKDVLDLGSWDGLWAFEAEKRGAKSVVATDTRMQGAENLLFAKQVLESKVFPLFNAPIQDISNRLKLVGLDPSFDIIHHLGLFYHLRDPLLSLTQARSVLREGGILLLETAAIDDDERSYMAWNGVGPDFHFYGPSDTWAPTRLCLKEILLRTKFEPVFEEKWRTYGSSHNALKSDQFAVERICLIAKAVAGEELHRIDHEKIEGNQ